MYCVMQRVIHRPRGVRDPVHAWRLYAREPGDLGSTCWEGDPAGRSGKVSGHNPGMYAIEKSDINIVPKKVPNKVSPPSGTAEALEGRAMTKGNYWKVVCDLYAETGGNIERT